jgi:hypothetical protein
LESRIGLTNLNDVDVGDVLVQEQYVTVSIYNRLLRKLDIDNGIDSDYEDTLKMSRFDDITVKMQSLNDKLVADDASGTITAKTMSADWETLQGQYNDLIGELNDVASDTLFDDYKTISGTISYEGIITSTRVADNTVTIAYTTPWLAGDINVFKGFKQVVQWSPQHFGDPSLLKQIRYGTIIFDQNNFYSAEAAYSTDVSSSFVRIPFLGKGIGYWGYGLYGQESPDFYWGGEGNDIPFRTAIPREKQRARYLNIKYSHIKAREYYRIVGVSAEIRSISRRAYR